MIIKNNNRSELSNIVKVNCFNGRSLGRRQFLWRAAWGVALGLLNSSCQKSDSNSGQSSPVTGLNDLGFLLYKNTSRIGVFDFKSQIESEIDWNYSPLNSPGVSLTPRGEICVAKEGDNSGFSNAIISLQGSLLELIQLYRPFAFQTSGLRFNTKMTRFAVAVDEPTSQSDDTRISKVIIYEYPNLKIVRTIENFMEPAWCPRTGELFVKHELTGQLKLFSADFTNESWIEKLTIPSGYAGFSLNHDGSKIVYEDGSLIWCYSRETKSSLLVASDKNSSLHSPVLSPDEKWLAFTARNITAYVPHVVPFDGKNKIDVISENHSLPNTLVDCRLGIAWGK